MHKNTLHMEANKQIGKIKDLGKDGATKADEFSETIQTAFDPPPSFSENYDAIFFIARSSVALRAADLDWIIGPEYSSDGYILEKNHEKPTWNHKKNMKNHDKP